MAKRRLEKSIDGTVVRIKEIESGEEMVFDFNELPADVQAKFGPFGLSHRLGDSAAGKSGQEAVESIQKVWDGLVAGNWTVRAPAGEKITKKSVLENLDNLPDEEKEAAKALLAQLGITV